MKDKLAKDEPVVLDMSALLGVNQIAELSSAADETKLGRVLSKIGEPPPPPPGSPFFAAKMLSKIGEGGGGAASRTAKLLSKIGEPPPPPPPASA